MLLSLMKNSINFEKNEYIIFVAFVLSLNIKGIAYQNKKDVFKQRVFLNFPPKICRELKKTYVVNMSLMEAIIFVIL